MHPGLFADRPRADLAFELRDERVLRDLRLLVHGDLVLEPLDVVLQQHHLRAGVSRALLQGLLRVVWGSVCFRIL